MAFRRDKGDAARERTDRHGGNGARRSRGGRVLCVRRSAISTVFCRSYPGRMRKRCAEHGLELYCEPYGNGPFNDLEYARECDVPMAEFWRPRGVGRNMV